MEIKRHQLYNNYGADTNGNVYSIGMKTIKVLKGGKTYHGYKTLYIAKRTFLAHRFIYECFHGIINDKKVIDHIDDVRDNNSISNLQLVTAQENCKKSAKNRNYDFAKNNHFNTHKVKATCEDGSVEYFASLYGVQRDLGINAGIVKMVCERLNRAKHGISKINGKKYSFVYINELPTDYSRIKRVKR